MDNWNFEETLKFYEAYPIGNINWGFFLYEELSKPIGFLPVYLSIYFCIALLIAFEDLKSSKNYKALYGLVIVILTAELFLLSAKGPLLILLVIAGFYLFRFFRNRVSFFSSLVIVSIIFCSVYFVPAISFRIKSMISEIGDQSYLKETETGNWHRLHLWKTSLNLVEKKMFFGYGLFGSEKVLAAELNKKGKAYFNSHNQYLMFLMATGVFGLAFIVFSIYCQLRVSILKKDAFYLCFLITIALILITENFLSRHKGLILYSFFNSIYFFSLKKK
jgi:O-antigen ligase